MTFYDIHHVTFGKDQDARKEGKKGNAVKSDLRNWKMSLAFRELWKNPVYRSHHMKAINEINSKRTRKDFSEMGKKSRLHENLVEQRIKNSFDFMFKPYEVCDRIAVKNDKIFFIEIKSRKHDRLTEKQRQFKNIAKENFIIEY